MDDRRKTAAQSTIDSHEDRLSWFVKWFREEAGKDTVNDRADVQPDVLDEHYNTLSKSENAEVRRGELPDEL